VNEMTPAHRHISLQVSLSAGMPVTMCVGEPGTQGLGVLGMQGIGVNTPRAAEVAEATVGLASDEHIPNGGMLVSGMLSVMIPTVMYEDMTGRGVATNVDGAAPNEHVISAPVTTCLGIAHPP